jgi:hypothetical protein
MSLRYFELVLAFICGFAFFGQIPVLSTIIGSGIIILSSIIATIVEKNKNVAKHKTAGNQTGSEHDKDNNAMKIKTARTKKQGKWTSF